MSRYYNMLPWIMVGVLVLMMGGIVFFLKQSDFYRLFYHKAIWAVVNGNINNTDVKINAAFMPHLNKQLAAIAPASPLSHCLNSFNKPHKAIAAIHDLWALTTINHLTFFSSPHHHCVAATVAAKPPFTIQYYFSSKMPDYYVLDSISGIDSLLLYCSQMPN